MAFREPSGCITLHILSPPQERAVLAFHAVFLKQIITAYRQDGSSNFTRWLPHVWNGRKVP